MLFSRQYKKSAPSPTGGFTAGCTNPHTRGGPNPPKEETRGVPHRVEIFLNPRDGASSLKKTRSPWCFNDRPLVFAAVARDPRFHSLETPLGGKTLPEFPPVVGHCTLVPFEDLAPLFTRIEPPVTRVVNFSPRADTCCNSPSCVVPHNVYKA